MATKIASRSSPSTPPSPQSDSSSLTSSSPRLKQDTYDPSSKRNPWIIHPNDPRYRLWEYFINALVFWSSFCAPYVWAMEPNIWLGYCIYEAVVGGIFAADMVIRLCFLAYVDKQRYALVEDRKMIAKR